MKTTGVFSLATAATATLPTKEIVTGVDFPIVNIGTWLAGSRKEDAHEITKNWLAQGFRGIDTALIYNDQGDIAKAIQESGVAREDLFITSKIPGCFAAASSVDSDLKQLNTDYIDLMLIHSPLGGGNCPNTWKVLEDYVAQGKLKSIGVSNFNAKQMQQVMDKATVPIAVNQIEYNVFSHDEDVIAFCDANGITVEAYSPLSGQGGAQSVFSDETVKAIAATHNVSAAQVALRWIVQRGHTIAVLSSSTEHQANDADLWSFELADDEMDTLTKLQGNSLATAAATLPTKEIAPGIDFPIVNIGTWLAGSRKEDAYEITKNWLAQGFRGIDTALIYNDQGDIAKAIQESGIAREDLFITSKIPGCFAAASSVDSDLKQLNTDYIDLMLIHSPLGGGNCPNTWKVLEDYVAQGKLKSIGVSNFNAKQMQQVMDKATVPIAVNQIEYNVFSHDEDVIAFCDANGITVEAYSPLSGQGGAQSVFSDETVKAIAATHNVSAAQVALRWIVQRGHTIAVLSSSSEHQANDADLWSFELADDEMDTLTKLQGNSVLV